MNESSTNVAVSPEDNLIISDQLMQQLDVFLNCFLIHLLSFLGIVGNALNILVLSSRGFKETSDIFLVSLSVSDLMFSVIQPIHGLRCIVSKFDVSLSKTVDTFVTVYVPITDIWVGLSIGTITAIAVERFFAVLFPFHVSRIFTPFRVKCVVVFLYVYTLGMTSPLSFRFDYEWVFDPLENRTTVRYINSNFYNDNYNAVNIYGGFFLNNSFTTATLLTILICSVVITIKLTVGHSKQLAMSSSGQGRKKVKDRRAGKMLLTVCLVALIVFLPTAIVDMYKAYAEINLFSQDNLKLNDLLQSINYVLYQFNASINIVIYVTMSRKFAAAYRNFCCPKTRTGKKH
ncbi:growth hormone secretagogue receptor type 1-like [Physella acuta]|uniref:growth hormone secretagogue receptor type 1-like n=1 Tax=Physella acuta TaxID=109671 RepID=UPI0027DACBCA|nr:growth hormone secretagogue receptor type 1-like [Physella acuta]